MARDVWGVIRTVALWVMIVFVTLYDALLWWQMTQMPTAFLQFCVGTWAVFWALIVLLVGGFEIYGNFFSPVKLTISNMYREWQKYEKANNKFQWSRVGLLMVWISFTGLIVHLWFYSGMFQ